MAWWTLVSQIYWKFARVVRGSHWIWLTRVSILNKWLPLVFVSDDYQNTELWFRDCKFGLVKFLILPQRLAGVKKITEESLCFMFLCRIVFADASAYSFGGWWRRCGFFLSLLFLCCSSTKSSGRMNDMYDWNLIVRLFVWD